jgi:hypothetical protein
MGDIRKLIASAVTGGDLSESEITETALDRVMALGTAGISSPLGTSLWRLKYANDHREYEPALALLTRQVRRPNQVLSFMRKLCQCVLNEWLDELCRKCGGRGHIVAEGTPHAKSACTSCSGHGVRAVSAQHRMRAMRLSDKAYPKWEAQFARAYLAIVDADDNAWLEVAKQLGRVGNRASFARRTLAIRRTAEIMRGNSSCPAHNENILPDSQLAAQPAHNDNILLARAGRVNAPTDAAPARP